jgi:hypothetical protein
MAGLPLSEAPLVVGFSDRCSARLHGVAGVGPFTAEFGPVVGIGDVSPSVRVRVYAEVVEQLPPTGAFDAALADFALVNGEELVRRGPRGGLVFEVLNEVSLGSP